MAFSYFKITALSSRKYAEYIFFDITIYNLNELKLIGNFVSHGNYVTGNLKTA